MDQGENWKNEIVSANAGGWMAKLDGENCWREPKCTLTKPSPVGTLRHEMMAMPTSAAQVYMGSENWMELDWSWPNNWPKALEYLKFNNQNHTKANKLSSAFAQNKFWAPSLYHSALSRFSGPLLSHNLRSGGLSSPEALMPPPSLRRCPQGSGALWSVASPASGWKGVPRCLQAETSDLGGIKMYHDVSSSPWIWEDLKKSKTIQQNSQIVDSPMGKRDPQVTRTSSTPGVVWARILGR